MYQVYLESVYNVSISSNVPQGEISAFQTDSSSPYSYVSSWKKL